jgi:hypothetical protein
MAEQKVLKRSIKDEQILEKMFTIFIKEMQVKTALRFHLTLVRMAIIKETNKQTNKTPNVCENIGQRTLLHYWEYKLV